MGRPRIYTPEEARRRKYERNRAYYAARPGLLSEHQRAYRERNKERISMARKLRRCGVAP